MMFRGHFNSLSEKMPILMALLAAFLFGLNAPLSKLLLVDISPMFMAAFLYLGAGIGMLLLHVILREGKMEAPLTRKELPWTVSMILLDVLAPFLLMSGLNLTTSANASLLLNFEMIATVLISFLFFHEAIGKRMLWSIGIITLAGILLSLDFPDDSTWNFSVGSLLILAACGCWGLENNCTRNMSAKSPAEIVILKGFGSGVTALAIAFFMRSPLPNHGMGIFYAFLLGFIAYGLSIFFYVKAQRHLGAARTSAYYAAAPFLGVVLSWTILREVPSWNFMAASAFMILGVVLAIRENHSHLHHHEKFVHNHLHVHNDSHHDHAHTAPVLEPHSHEHTHEECTHSHAHTPDIHHRHTH